MGQPTTEEAEYLLESAKETLWRSGILTWKLHEDQLAVYGLILAAFAAGASRFVLEIARRWGKTWELCVIAIETAVRNPGGRIVYGAPTLKDLQEFIIPTIEAITADAPPGLRWSFNAQTMHFTCENGAYIHLFGCDDKRKANRGRGPGAVLVILDECGFIPILLYVIQSVLRPQLLHSGGGMLLGSTPADEPDHDFTKIAELAEANNNYARRTIHDNPLLTPERIAAFIEADAKDAGLSVEEYKLTDAFRREYMAERVVNKLLVVVPEWEEKRLKLIRPVPRPQFFDGMTVLDPGGHDPHALSFMYWHFELAALVVEDELLLRDGQNSHQIMEAAKAKERQLWGVEKYDGTLRAAIESDVLREFVPDWMAELIIAKEAPEQPYVRWMDVNEILCRDLYQLHKMAFITTRKDNKEAAVNNLRNLMRSEQFLLSPNCKHTDRHLKQTTWKDAKRKEYARKAGEHGDLLDTCVYGARNVDRQRNPAPKNWGHPAPIVHALQRQQNERVSEALMGSSALAQRLIRRRR